MRFGNGHDGVQTENNLYTCNNCGVLYTCNNCDVIFCCAMPEFYSYDGFKFFAASIRNEITSLAQLKELDRLSCNEIILMRIL